MEVSLSTCLWGCSLEALGWNTLSSQGLCNGFVLFFCFLFFSLTLYFLSLKAKKKMRETKKERKEMSCEYDQVEEERGKTELHSSLSPHTQHREEEGMKA